MMKMFRTWGLGLFAALALAFSVTATASESLLVYLQPGYMYASAEAEFTCELAHYAGLPASGTVGSTGGLVRDGHGFVQHTADSPKVVLIS